MDVIQPQLIRIENRCYRKNPVAPSWGTTEIEEQIPDIESKLSGPCMHLFKTSFPPKRISQQLL